MQNYLLIFKKYFVLSILFGIMFSLFAVPVFADETDVPSYPEVDEANEGRGDKDPETYSDSGQDKAIEDIRKADAYTREDVAKLENYANKIDRNNQAIKENKEKLDEATSDIKTAEEELEKAKKEAADNPDDTEAQENLEKAEKNLEEAKEKKSEAAKFYEEEKERLEEENEKLKKQAKDLIERYTPESKTEGQTPIQGALIEAKERSGKIRKIMEDHSQKCKKGEVCVELSEPILVNGKTQMIIEGEGGGGLNMLKKYASVIYKYMAGIIGFIAVLIVVVSGLQISASGAIGEANAVSEAKERITRALLTLAIVFLTSVILYTVNPVFFTID